MLSRPFIQLILVQIREFYREPGVIFWSLLFPILMAWGLGIAFSKKPEVTRTVAVVLDEPKTLDDLRNAIAASKPELKFDSLVKEHYLQVDYGNDTIGITHFILRKATMAQAELMVKRGKSSLIVKATGDGLTYHFDRLNAEAQLAYLQFSSLTSGIDIEEFSSHIVPITEKGTRYIDFLIPGLLAMNIMMSTMWGISYSLIEARTKKLLRRMVATPMPRWEYIISHFVARVLLCVVEASIVFAFSYYYFGITIEGSTWAFAALFLSGIVAFTGIAVLVACRTSKTQVGNGLINLVIMPMMLLSGIYFSYHNFPESIIPLIQALPLTMLADGFKAIFNEGAGFVEVFKYIAILVFLGMTAFGLGLKFFKWY
jgi:ABC-type multidrug transport system permease subunit